MSNKILTPKEFVDDLRAFAAEYVAQMPLDAVREVAAIRTFSLGIGGALLATLVEAANARLAAG